MTKQQGIHSLISLETSAWKETNASFVIRSVIVNGAVTKSCCFSGFEIYVKDNSVMFNFRK